MFYPCKMIVIGHKELGIPSSGSSFNLVAKVFAEQHIVDVKIIWNYEESKSKL
jgi:hypothetical protein